MQHTSSAARKLWEANRHADLCCSRQPIRALPVPLRYEGMDDRPLPPAPASSRLSSVESGSSMDSTSETQTPNATPRSTTAWQRRPSNQRQSALRNISLRCQNLHTLPWPADHSTPPKADRSRCQSRAQGPPKHSAPVAPLLPSQYACQPRSTPTTGSPSSAYCLLHYRTRIPSKPSTRTSRTTPSATSSSADVTRFAASMLQLHA